MNAAYIGLGSNLGDSSHYLDKAIHDLTHHPKIHQLYLSSRYKSAPVDSHGPDYVNAVAYLETSLSSLELLAALQTIENAHGRERPYLNAPRTLDLDILLFNEEKKDDPRLTLPHPRMFLRAFVLAPLKNLQERYPFLKKQSPKVNHDLDTYLQKAKEQGQLLEKIPD